MSSIASFVGSHTYTGMRMQQLCFGKSALCSYLLYITVGLVQTLRTGSIWPLLIILVLIYGFVRMMDAFLKEHYEECCEKDFSFQFVLSLQKHKELTVRTLVETMTHSPRIQFILEEIGADAKEIQLVASNIEEPVEQLFTKTKEHLAASRQKEINEQAVLYALFVAYEPFQHILRTHEHTIVDLEHILQWELFHYRYHTKLPWYHPSQLLQAIGSIGRTWSSGYTSMLDELTIDIGKQMRFSDEKDVRIHQEELATAVQYIEQPEHHDTLILGDVGCGKTTFIRHVLLRIRRHERAAHKSFTRLLRLDTEKLLSGKHNNDTFLLHALDHARVAGKFILIIDRLPSLLRAADSKLRQILLKLFQEKHIQIITTISNQEYYQYVQNDPLIDSLFTKVQLDSGTEQETMGVLMEEYFSIEKKQHVHVTYRALRQMYELSDRYIGKTSFPGKATGVLEQVLAIAVRDKLQIADETLVRSVVSHVSNIDVNALSSEGREKLLQLDTALSKEIIGQSAAIKAISNVFKRSKTDIHAKKKPIGTFLFLGPTGVGKTHTAKVLARTYFGGAEHIVRLDMNEYIHSQSVADLIGTPAAPSYLVRSVLNAPASLILLDELEKAHPAVLNLFLQILDEGHMLDANGAKINFQNTIIIATSNAGALFLRDFLQGNPAATEQELEKQLTDHILKEQMFSPEFLNRFDELIVFKPLTIEQAEIIVKQLVHTVEEDLLKRKGILLEVSGRVQHAIAKQGYSIEFGARELRRMVQETVENYVAEEMLKRDVKRGGVITMN